MSQRRRLDVNPAQSMTQATFYRIVLIKAMSAGRRRKRLDSEPGPDVSVRIRSSPAAEQLLAAAMDIRTDCSGDSLISVRFRCSTSATFRLIRLIGNSLQSDADATHNALFLSSLKEQNFSNSASIVRVIVSRCFILQCSKS